MKLLAVIVNTTYSWDSMMLSHPFLFSFFGCFLRRVLQSWKSLEFLRANIKHKTWRQSLKYLIKAGFGCELPQIEK